MTIRAKEDLTDKYFGKWHVIREASKEEKTNASNRVYWLCECECGIKKYVEGSNLKSGKSTSCGHCNHKFEDLTGKRFDKLVVLREATKDEILNNTKSKTTNKHYWWVQCDCGSPPKVVFGGDLKSGKITSCKCNQKVIAKKNAEIYLSQYTKETKRMKDLTNQTFGYLTVLYPTKKRKCRSIVWHCKCKCGNECDISSNLLLGNHTHSCGCLTKSLGEIKIEELLKQNDIYYEKEKKFTSCVSPINDNYKLRFDFYINNSYLIEYDGKQHYEAEGYGWDTKEKLKETQIRDKLKNEWCKKNNIPLIRIPYTHLNDLCLEDLLLETSNFII